MSSLIEISYEINDLVKTEVVDEKTGEVIYDPREEKQLTLILADKIDGFVNYLNALDKELERIDEAIEFAKRKKKQYQGRRNYLLSCADTALTILDKKKLEGAIGHSISARRSVQVIVENVGDLPEKYVRSKITHEPDKILIKEALNRGEEILGCRLQENRSIVYE